MVVLSNRSPLVIRHFGLAPFSGQNTSSGNILLLFLKNPISSAIIKNNPTSGQQIGDPFEKLLAMDHDDRKRITRKGQRSYVNDFALVKVG